MFGFGMGRSGVVGGMKLLSSRIASLFRSGEQGVWYDPSDLSTLYQDSAGTTPVTAVEQPVGLMLDNSGRGNHAYQSTSASRPVLSARVNLLTYTEQFDNAAWTGTTNVTPNAAAAPNGSITADLITTTGVSSSHIRQKVSLKAAQYELSFWVKGGTSTSPSFGMHLSGFLSGSATVVSGPGSVSGTSHINVTGLSTSQWTQVRFIFTSTESSPTFYFYPEGGGVGTGKGIYIWGADLRPTNTGVNLPPYQRVNTATDYDTAGFPHYLRFDGIDDFLVTNSINFTGTDKMTVAAGVRKLSDLVVGTLAELSPLFSNDGTFAVLVPPDDGLARYGFSTRGTTTTAFQGSSTYTHSAPITNVLSVALDNAQGAVAADAIKPRVNGAAMPSVSDGQNSTTPANFGNYPLYIGRRGGTARPFNGHLYSLIVRGAQSSDAQITSVEMYVNGKTKAYA